MKPLSKIFAVTSIALIATAAHAGSDLGTARSETVRFADLNLASPQGSAQLYKRIHAAAQNVCRDLDGPRSLTMAQAHQACVQHAIDGAVEAVNAPQLSDYALRRGNGRPGMTLARNK